MLMDNFEMQRYLEELRRLGPIPRAYADKALLCPICKVPFSDTEFGWVKEYGTHSDHAGHQRRFGYCMVRCSGCARDALSKIAMKRQAELVARLFGGADIPDDARLWTFKNFPVDADRAALKAVQDFVTRHLAGDMNVKRGCYIGGAAGRGKTSLAISALKAVMEQGHMALFVMSTELFKRIQRSLNGHGEDELLEAITTVPWLVLDDLGTENSTAFVIRELYLIIQKRRQQGLYTIFTSNMSTPDLEERWRPADVAKGQFHDGTRVLERIKEYCVGIPVEGRNLRERSAKR